VAAEQNEYAHRDKDKAGNDQPGLGIEFKGFWTPVFTGVTICGTFSGGSPDNSQPRIFEIFLADPSTMSWRNGLLP
jgi:hypothetical protein